MAIEVRKIAKREYTGQFDPSAIDYGSRCVRAGALAALKDALREEEGGGGYLLGYLRNAIADLQEETP